MNIYLGNFNGCESFNEVTSWLENRNPNNYPVVFMATLKDENVDVIYMQGNGSDLLKLLVEASAQIMTKICHNDKSLVPLASAALCEDIKSRTINFIDKEVDVRAND